MNDQQTFYEEAGRRIREARKRRKPRLTQEELAKMVSLTRTSITNIEKGYQRMLLHTLVDIAAALHIEPGSLFPWSDAKLEPQLDEPLGNRPKSEKEWIKSAKSTAQKGRGSDSPQSAFPSVNSEIPY